MYVISDVVRQADLNKNNSPNSHFMNEHVKNLDKNQEDIQFTLNLHTENTQY